MDGIQCTRVLCLHSSCTLSFDQSENNRVNINKGRVELPGLNYIDYRFAIPVFGRIVIYIET